MAFAKSLLAYADCQDFLDKALASENGIAVTFPTKGAALHCRIKCYAFRKYLRDESLKVYKPDEPGWGRTAYDALTIPTPTTPKLEIKKGMGAALPIEDL